ncbi:nuclear transport factor 2 family protein [Dyadobacter sp. 676]|uniref:Nuclear transport factor 2 family protein n=1 Tax=Dyadobacter sp. 676 TaxID=3088362 RepID=A0AAU8FGK7_9BACT
MTTYSSIFRYADEHNWEGLANAFTEDVDFDYHSLSGQAAQTIKSAQITANWAAFLPKFKFTMHYLCNHFVEVNGLHATAFCYGQAIHQQPNDEIWTVYGKYYFRLTEADGRWKVSAIRYEHKYAQGNLNLP